jgi:hypothetical protein
MAKGKKKKTKSSSKHRNIGLIDKYINEHPKSLDRPEPSREEKENFLIYCEGKNTEPSYFNKFRLLSATIRSFGEGNNTLSLVRRAIEFRNSGKYDQVWCVFDGDDNSLDNFNNAVFLIEKEKEREINGKPVKLRAAYSIQAFEYWLILHFNDHQGHAMPRNEYNDKLNLYINPLGASYDGTGDKIISQEFFDILEGTELGEQKSRRELAISRAKRNHDKRDHSSPGIEESTTTVFALVEEIKKYI